MLSPNGRQKKIKKNVSNPLDNPTNLWYNKYVIKGWKSLENKIKNEVYTMTTSTSTRKTQRDYYAEIRTILENGGFTELVEFVDGRVAQLDKKNTAERKPTARQTENAGFKADILAFMEPDTLYAASDITKSVPSIVAAGLSSSRVTAMLTQLTNDGSIVRTEEKRKHFYSLA